MGVDANDDTAGEDRSDGKAEQPPAGVHVPASRGCRGEVRAEQSGDREQQKQARQSGRPLAATPLGDRRRPQVLRMLRPSSARGGVEVSVIDGVLSFGAGLTGPAGGVAVIRCV